MSREQVLRRHTQGLLEYDLAVCAWLERGGVGSREGGEIPFDRPPEHETDAAHSSRPSFQLAGFDEAGRGALAGPVVVGCVHLDLARGSHGVSSFDLVEQLSGVDDSKRLSPARRERLFGRIAECAEWAIGSCSASDVDRLGIVAACRTAATRAYRNLAIGVDVGIFDRGLSLRRAGAIPGEAAGLPTEVTATRADGLSLHVAAASIVAKVARDRMMCCLAGKYEGFAFERHKGYGTSAHRETIRSLGPTRIHRRTFLRLPENAKSQSC